MEFTLDVKLVPQPLKPGNVVEFNQSVATKGHKISRDAIKGDYRHKNFLEYLALAYGSHYGVVLQPDMIWQVILCEVAGHIKANAEEYRSLFTTSDAKVEIRVPTSDPELIDLNLIKAELMKLVPTNVELFLPEFSTTTEQSSLAFTAAFAEAMTPFYKYSMFMCGIPCVKVEGTKHDWIKAYNSVTELANLFPKLSDYFKRVTIVLLSIFDSYEQDMIEFYRDMFFLKKCGSGSQVTVEGWVKDLYIKNNPRPGYVTNYPTLISKVPYTNINTHQKFELNYGLFSSTVHYHYLVPEFGFIITEEKSFENV